MTIFRSSNVGGAANEQGLALCQSLFYGAKMVLKRDNRGKEQSAGTRAAWKVVAPTLTREFWSCGRRRRTVPKRSLSHGAQLSRQAWRSGISDYDDTEF